MKFRTTEQLKLLRLNDQEEIVTDFQKFLQTSNKLSNINKGVSIAWKNLSVIACQKEQSIFGKEKRTYKTIIHDVTGAIFPGNLVAIMGASGSGKTTLMSVLANRSPSGFQIEGDIRINCKPSGEFIRHISGYVYQDDLFISTLTIMEHLNFAAKLRLDRNVTEQDRKQLILRVLREVGLLRLANTSIGSSNAGKDRVHLSGGERKRLSVATELLTEPLLLFCDEPTTGLDSFSAQKLISTMRSIAMESNKTIVCSIHQPNRQIFELFKQIILLSSGRIVFSGSSSDAVKFFQSQGYHYDDQNPAEYLIKSIAKKREKEVENGLESSLHKDFSNSEYSRTITTYVENVMKQDDDEEFIASKLNNTKPPSWCRKLSIITHRSFLTITRTSSVQNVRIIQKALLGILLGLCLHGTITKTQPGLRAFQAAVYVIFVQNFHPAFFSILAYIPDQLPIFYREYSNSSNLPSLFYLSNVFALLPGSIFEPLSYSLIIYYLAGLRGTYFTVIMSSIAIILLFHVTNAFGMLASLFFKNKSVALSFCGPLLNTYMFTCGLFIKLSSIPFIISWIRYTSWFTYGLASVYIIHLKDVYNIACDSKVKLPCFKTGREVLKNYDFHEHSLGYNLMMMVFLYFIFHVAAYVCLCVRIRNRSA